SSAEATTLGAGTFTVGQDVAPGRYVLEPGAGQSGNVHAATAEDPLVINEILGDAAGLGVPSVTTTLIEGEELEISGLSEVTFTPAETELRTTLGTGDWVVGLDVAPGDYVVTPAEGGWGNFVVYDSSGFPDTNGLLGDAEGLGVPEGTIPVPAGEEIQISGISEVTFAEKYTNNTSARVLAHHPGPFSRSDQAQVVPQAAARVLGAEPAATLQLRD